MSPRDADLLEAILVNKVESNTLRVLEWGAGVSTTALFKSMYERGMQVNWLSLESDLRFYKKFISPKVRTLRNYHVMMIDRFGKEAIEHQRLEKADPTVLRVIVHDLGALNPTGYNWRDRMVNADAYVYLPSFFNEQFDVILVDGRFRRRCLLEARYLLQPGGVVVLHDAWRKHYHCAMETFPSKSFVGEDLWLGANDPTAFEQLLENLGPQDSRKIVRQIDMNSTISGSDIGRSFRVHDGVIELELQVTEKMAGKHFGDFRKNRRRLGHIKSWLRAQTRRFRNARYFQFQL
jgi:ribosomal protein S19